MRELASLAAAAVLCTATLIGQPSGSSGDPVFRSETRLVEVTVIARDGRGRPITDLRADEIRLLDDGQEQKVQYFQPAGAFIGGSQSAARRSIVVLDALHTDLSDRVRVKRALAKLFQNLEIEQDRVAVWIISSSATRLHDFTDDPANLQALVVALDAKPPIGSPAGALTGALAWGKPYRNVFDEGTAMRSLASLSFIAEANSELPGQKNLIWISSGFAFHNWMDRPALVYPSNDQALPGIVSYAGYDDQGYRANRMHSPPGPVGETVLDHVQRRLGSSKLLKAAELMTRKLNAANVNLYPVDASGLSVSPRAGRHTGTLRQLAKKTGGKAFYDRNDIDGLVTEALEDTRSGYVLSYSPSGTSDDGQPRSIKIATTRRGVRLQYRRSYYGSGRYDPRDANIRWRNGK